MWKILFTGIVVLIFYIIIVITCLALLGGEMPGPEDVDLWPK